MIWESLCNSISTYLLGHTAASQSLTNGVPLIGSMLAATEQHAVGPKEIIVIVVYLMLIGYLGYLGWKQTKTAADYMVAGRKVHPFIMALSYGATFISTSAIVGFGGVAGLFGMSLLWLTFLNIFVGIFIAFVFIAPSARRLGHRLNAHTFPEILGRRYESRFMQVFAGLIIFLFIPLYAAAVLMGGCEFIAVQFEIPYEVALLVFSVIIAAYVVVGGLKGVMYTDALQGSIMFIGMLVLLFYSYSVLGGLTEAHGKLGEITPLVTSGGKLAAIGHPGWTATPEFGWGDLRYNLWWIVFSTIVLGVGIGVLAQPQLIVRFMTVKSRRELNRAVLVGGVFILIMTGVAFTVGSLSNAYFAENGTPFTGRVLKMIDAEKGQAIIQLTKPAEGGGWEDIPDKKVPVVLDAEAASPGTMEMDGESVELVQGRSFSIIYAGGNANQIIPTYLKEALPDWFGTLFLLTLLAAAMSTLSSQFHAVGTSIGRDVYEQFGKASDTQSIAITRIGIVIGIVIAVLLSLYSRESTMIARATAIFFGLCASAFLPAFFGGLYWKKATRPGAIASMVVGFVVTAFWLTFVKAKEAAAIGLVQKLTDGKTSIFAGHHNWDVVDPLVIALPLSIIVFVVVSLITKAPQKSHIDHCFGKTSEAAATPASDSPAS